jgi:uncharacterized protein (DUF924 family)
MAEDGDGGTAARESAPDTPDEGPVGSTPDILGVEGPDADAQAVLDFWFGELTPKQWFSRDATVDRTVSERFGTLAARVATGGVPHWAGAPGGMLAAVIALDQFPRNLYRDDPRAFASDDQALALADQAIRDGADKQMSAPAKQFLYMPFMHSEAIEDQDRAVALFETIGIEAARQSAHQHRDIIRRFGRFPHRNAVLGRETTDEEAGFLEQPGSRF